MCIFYQVTISSPFNNYFFFLKICLKFHNNFLIDLKQFIGLSTLGKKTYFHKENTQRCDLYCELSPGLHAMWLLNVRILKLYIVHHREIVPNTFRQRPALLQVFPDFLLGAPAMQIY